MPPFDPSALAQWLIDGVKETVSYRLKQTLNKDKWIEKAKSKIPSKNQAMHFALKHLFKKSGFVFEELKQGDAVFHVIRKKFREVAHGKEVRRLVVVPGFGDSPASWIPPFTFLSTDLPKNFDAPEVERRCQQRSGNYWADDRQSHWRQQRIRSQHFRFHAE